MRGWHVEDGARDDLAPACRPRADGDRALVGAGRLAAVELEPHAPLAGDQVRVDEVDGSSGDGIEQAGQHGPPKELRVAVGDGARDGDLHVLEVLRVELDGEAAEALGESDEGPQLATVAAWTGI